MRMRIVQCNIVFFRKYDRVVGSIRAQRRIQIEPIDTMVEIIVVMYWWTRLFVTL